MPRTPAEWIGKTDDTDVPPRVRTRVFLAKGGKCHRCGRKVNASVEKWTCEHLTALCNGGENRERNLGVTCSNCLPAKNAEDVAEKSKVNRKRAKHLGVTRPAGKLQSRGFAPAPPQQRARKPLTKALPPRVSLFE